MKYSASFGMTVQAYGTVEIEADSLEQLWEKANDVLDDNCDAVRFEMEWGSADDYRVVRVLDEADKYVDVDNMALNQQ